MLADDIDGAAALPTLNCVSCGRRFARGAHVGYCNSGIGLAWKILRVCAAIQRAEVFAFLRRALSV